MSFLDEEHLDEHYPCRQAYAALQAERYALAAKLHERAAQLIDAEVRATAIASDNDALRVEIAKWRAERDVLAAELASAKLEGSRHANRVLTAQVASRDARVQALEAELAAYQACTGASPQTGGPRAGVGRQVK